MGCGKEDKGFRAKGAAWNALASKLMSGWKILMYALLHRGLKIFWILRILSYLHQQLLFGHINIHSFNKNYYNQPCASSCGWYHGGKENQSLPSWGYWHWRTAQWSYYSIIAVLILQSGGALRVMDAVGDVMSWGSGGVVEL